MKRKPHPALILLMAALLLAAAVPAAYGAYSLATPDPAPPEAALQPENGGGAAGQPQISLVATTTPLADGVWHYISDIGGFITTSLIVIDGGEVLITDPSHELMAQSMREEIAKLTDDPVSIIVLTHEHYDHAAGTSGFGDEATIICHINCQPIFDLDVLGDVPDVDLTYATTLDVEVGDKLVELHYLGPGDGEATTVVYMPEEEIVATADLYEPRALTHKNWVDDKNFSGVRHILNTVSGWELTHAVNAHSTGTNPRDLRENAAYYDDLFHAVYEAVAAAAAEGGGRAVFELSRTLPDTLVLEDYQDWVNYDNSFPRHVERMFHSITHGD